MFVDLKTDLNAELKLKMKSLWDAMKNGYNHLEENVSELNETVKKLDRIREEAESQISKAEDHGAATERLLPF